MVWALKDQQISNSRCCIHLYYKKYIFKMCASSGASIEFDKALKIGSLSQKSWLSTCHQLS